MNSHYKTLLAGLLIILLTSAVGFSQEKGIDIKKPDIQIQVFDQILNDNDLIDDFITRLQSNQDAMKYLMSKMMLKCCTDSAMCDTLTEKVSEHDEILERLGKVLLEKEDSNYTVKPRPRYKHK
jgi:hypothetical protein